MNIGFIPLREGSKGIPGKNRKSLLGRPLFTWSLIEAQKSILDKVYVYTDDIKIKEYINSEYSLFSKIIVLDRSEESASDTASTEFAIDEFARLIGNNFKSISLIQATSPLITKDDINNCVNAVNSGYDSALTVVPYKRFFWNSDGTPINYDYFSRPRRQEFEGTLVENGACYTTTLSSYLNTKNRISGKIKLIEMNDDSLVEIDELSDFVIVESLLVNRIRNSSVNLRNIKLLCLDVDGVLTDGSAQYTNDGENSKGFSLFDGKGLELIRSVGIEVCVITSEISNIVKSRMMKLKIDNVFFGVKDKYSILDNFITKNNIKWSEVAYIGDDVNDMTSMIASGVSFCPSNADESIKSISKIILKKSGGFGAVREVCNILLKFNKL